MTALEKFLSLALLAVLLILGAVLWAWRDEPVPAALSAKDAAFQRADLALDLSGSTEAAQSVVATSYGDAIQSRGLPDARPFAKQHGAQVAAVLMADGTFPAAQGVLAQPLNFRVTEATFRQTTGSLQTAQIAVQELDSGGHVVGEAKLSNVKLTYAPPPPPPLFNPVPVLVAGALIPGVLPPHASPAIGLGTNLLQWHGFGLGVVALVAPWRLQDSAVAMPLSWRPELFGHVLNAGLALGPAISVSGAFGGFVGLQAWAW